MTEQQFYRDKWEGITTPETGNRWDSRFNGPTPWMQALQQYSDLGNPIPQRPFEGLGKFDITESLPVFPQVAQADMQGAPPTRQPVPQPGLFESLGRGLPTMFAQFLGNGDLTKMAGDIGGTLGSLVDLPLRVVPSFDFLSGGYDVQELFDALPEDAEKREYESYIASDKSNAIRYMSEYLDRNPTDVARKLGVSGAFSPALTPSMDLSEQFRRIVFGGLSALGDGVARTYVGSGLRDVQGSILDAAPGALPPELQAIQDRWRAGEFRNIDEVYDELTIGAHRWTNDDSLWGRGVSLIMDIISDPLVWASFGIGGAAKAIESGSIRAGKIAVSKSVTDAGLREGALDAAAAAAGLTRPVWEKSVGREGIHNTLDSFAKANRPDLVDAAMGTLSRRQRALIGVEPLIQPAAKVAESIDSMFGWFGLGAAGRAMSSKVTHARMRGFASYYGARRIRELQDFFGASNFGDFSRYLGIAGNNTNASLHQKHLAREAMGTDPNWRGTNLAPDDAVRARMDMDEHFSTEAEVHTARTTRDFRPAAEGETAFALRRSQEIDQLATDISLMTRKPKDEVRAFLDKQDSRGLGLAHQVVYGYSVSRLNVSKRDAMASLTSQIAAATTAGDIGLVIKLAEHRANVQRYTLVSERTLTRQRAEALLVQIDAATPAGVKAARDAIEDYDTLGHSFGDGRLNGDDLREAMADHIRELLKDPDNRLINTVDPTKLDPDIARAMGGSKYEVGLAPTDRWGITRGADGRVKGVNTFIDAIDEVMPDNVVRPWGARDVWKERFFGQIHGARLYYEAEAKFRDMGQREYGLNKRDAQRLFRGIHAKASESKIGPRGLTPDDVVQIANDLDLTPAMRARVGPGSLMELVLRSFEGDLATVGLAPKASGKLKTAGSRLGNWVGIIAEKYYPFLRFGLNPIFVMMESVEGPFFALLRGIKPGVRWTQRDLRMNAILDYLGAGKERYTDQLERVQSATLDLDMARRLTVAIDGQRGWRRLLPTNWKKSNPLEKGLMSSGVWDNKHLQYVKQAGRTSADQWVEWMDRYNPDLLARWETELGPHASRQDLFMRFMEERGAFTDNNRHLIHLMDAVKPVGLGKRERLRVGDIAHFHGYQTTAELYDAVNTGALDEAAFIQRYEYLNVPRPFAERAWKIVKSPTEDEWALALNDAFGVHGAKAFMDLHRLMAEKQGLTLREFLANEYGGVPDIVTSAAALPATAVFQQATLRDGVERAGMTFHEPGSPKYDAALEQVRMLGPDVPTAEMAGAVRATGLEGNADGIPDAANPFDRAELSNVQAYRLGETVATPGEFAVADLIPEYARPPELGTVNEQSVREQGVLRPIHITPGGRILDGHNRVAAAKAAGLETVPVEVHRIKPPSGVKYANAQLDKVRTGRAAQSNPDLVPEVWRGVDHEQMLATTAANALNDFGGDMTAINEAADWYKQMMSVFVGIADAVPESMIHNLLDEWVKRNPTGVRAAAGDAPTGTLTADQARAQLSARLMVAFTFSQMNSSVLSGVRAILNHLDKTAYGFGKGATGLDPIPARMERLLAMFTNAPPESIGLKLFDFFDSLAQNRTRSVSSAIGDSLQPAAMDIWMKRAWGYGDAAYLNKAAISRLQKQGKPVNKANVRQAEAEVAAEMKWDLDATRKNSGDAPTEAEYQWMLERTNELTKYFNDNGLITRNGVPRTDLTASEVQALVWVGLQKRMLYADSPPVALLRQAGVQMAAEVVPGATSGHLARWLPDSDEIARLDAGGDVARARQIGLSISQEVQRAMVPMISEEVGVIPVYQLDSPANRWTPEPQAPEAGAEGPTYQPPTSFQPNATTIYTGSERQFLTAMRITGMLQEQDAIYGMATWPEVTLKPSSNTPIIRSNTESGRFWSMDLTFSSDLRQADVAPYLEPLEVWFEGAVKRAGIDPQEFPGSMSGVLDDESIAVRHAWTQSSSAKLQQRFSEAQAKLPVVRKTLRDAQAKVRDEVLEARIASLKADLAGSSGGGLLAVRLMDDLGEAERELQRIKDEATPDEIKAAKEVESVVKAGTHQASLPEMEAGTQLLPEDLAALQDGSWVKQFEDERGAIAPMPIEIRRSPVQVHYLDGDHAAALRELGVDPDAVRDRHQATVRGLYLDAYTRHAPKATRSKYGAQSVIDGRPNGYFLQRDGKSGAVRGAFAPAGATSRAATFFIRGAADPSTGIHESFHLFARHLEPSSRGLLVDAYNRAHPGDPPRTDLDHDVEEWLAYQFEAFAAGDYAHAGEFGATFVSYARWAEGRTKKGSALDGTFAQVLKDWGDVDGATFDTETERMWEAARLATLRGEEEAHTTAYYRHSRNWIERSMNHPYLGLYPISYMWGKVLPELTRFLVRRPFGLKAPLGGLAAAAHVWRNVQMQLQIDEELRKFIDGHPETIRLLAMMTPGTPWELPVNLPAYFRHFQEREAENQLRAIRGQEPLKYDWGSAISDSFQYSVGYANVLERAGKILPELAGLPRDVAQAATTGGGNDLNSYTGLDTQS